MRQKKLGLGLAALTLLASALAIAAGPYPTQLITNRFGGSKQLQMIRGGSNQVDVSFKVAAADSGGFGVTGVSGASSVFMHTSQTPGSGNPNPPAGTIIVNLSQNFSSFVAGYWSLQSPANGSTINVTSGLTNNLDYVIASVGTTTTSTWQSLGLPVGITPAVGVPFVAASPSPTGTGTGTVYSPVATGSGVTAMEILGLPVPSVSGAGAQIMLRTLAATSSSVTTLVATNPADGTIVHLRFTFNALPTSLQ